MAKDKYVKYTLGELVKYAGNPDQAKAFEAAGWTKAEAAKGAK